MFVCKTWYELAVSIFYKTIKLSGSKPHKFKMLFNASLQQPRLPYGEYTESLAITSDTLYGEEDKNLVNYLERDQLLYLLKH